jgi:Mandelate racemase / muconate lactonizing enzyme, N-terminal domain
VSAGSPGPVIESVEASAFTIPAEQPEQDGTLEWSQTTLLLVQARAGGSTGTGYSYAHPAAAGVVNGQLAEIVHGCDPLAVGRAWAAMWRAARNLGQTGLVSMAVSAVDVALRDLKARLLGRAGSWGFEDSKWQISLDCGEQAFLPAARSAPPGAVVVANGFSCQTQLQQAPGTSREAMHLAQVMALARQGKSTRARRQDAGARPVPPPGIRLARTGPVVLAALAAAAVPAAWLARRRRR